jgi:hypothetical protein
MLLELIVALSAWPAVFGNCIGGKFTDLRQIVSGFSELSLCLSCLILYCHGGYCDFCIVWHSIRQLKFLSVCWFAFDNRKGARDADNIMWVQPNGTQVQPIGLLTIRGTFLTQSTATDDTLR